LPQTPAEHALFANNSYGSTRSGLTRLTLKQSPLC